MNDSFHCLRRNDNSNDEDNNNEDNNNEDSNNDDGKNDDENVSDLDQAMINYINFFNNKEQSKIPTPTPFIVSTRSAMCKMEHVSCLDLSKIVSLLVITLFQILFLKKIWIILIRGISIENIIFTLLMKVI